MIDIKELRIGNIVTSNIYIEPTPFLKIYSIQDHLNVSVGAMNLKDNTDMSYEYSNLSPIKLTEELLLNCGFEIIKPITGAEKFYSFKRKAREYTKPAITIYHNRTTVGNDSTVKHVIYLHQLQNLYFVLTGSELEINLT